MRPGFFLDWGVGMGRFGSPAMPAAYRTPEPSITVDRLRSIDLRVEALMVAARGAASQHGTVYQKKNHIKGALASCRAQAERDYEHVPLFEAFVTFQLMTAARRGEALNVTRDNVDFDERTAYLPETKNGKPRKLPLRAELVEGLKLLPRDDARVFPLGEDALKHAWAG